MRNKSMSNFNLEKKFKSKNSKTSNSKRNIKEKLMKISKPSENKLSINKSYYKQMDT